MATARRLAAVMFTDTVGYTAATPAVSAEGPLRESVEARGENEKLPQTGVQKTPFAPW